MRIYSFRIPIKDIGNVKEFAKLIYIKTSLKCFIDSEVWGCTDDLLADLDQDYCLQDDGYINYSKNLFIVFSGQYKAQNHRLWCSSMLSAAVFPKFSLFFKPCNASFRYPELGNYSKTV